MISDLNIILFFLYILSHEQFFLLLKMPRYINLTGHINGKRKGTFFRKGKTSCIIYSGGKSLWRTNLKVPIFFMFIQVRIKSCAVGSAA